MDIIDGIQNMPFNDEMAYLNSKFNEILLKKKNELHELFTKSKTKKMIQENDVNIINFNVKTTLAKIHAEQDRKLKMSKAYKKKEHYAASPEIQNINSIVQSNTLQDITQCIASQNITQCFT